MENLEASIISTSLIKCQIWKFLDEKYNFSLYFCSGCKILTGIDPFMITKYNYKKNIETAKEEYSIF